MICASLALLFVSYLGWQALNLRRKRQLRSAFLSANHLQTWPDVRGRLPGNVDVLYRLGKDAYTRLPGANFAQLCQRYGPTFDLRPLGGSVVYSQDPDVARHILAINQPNYVKGRFLNELFDDVLGSGIFNSDGEQWKTHRQAARPFFQKENLTNFVIFEKYTEVLIRALRTLSGNGNSPRAVEFHDLAARFTLDAASDFLFGASIASLDAVIASGPDPPYLSAFQRVQRTLAARLGAGSMWRWFDKGVGQDMTIINNMVDSAIQRAESSTEGTYHGFTTLLELLNRETPRMSDIAKRQELLNVLMAARDTTASLIASVVYELACHPAVQDALRQEVQDNLGEDEILTFQGVKHLKLMRAVINETLRMYPPISANSRIAVKDDVIVAGGQRFHVPAGTHIACGVFQMHRRLDLWGADANEWQPHRWMDGRGVPAANMYAFQAWGIGPRICIGQELAYLETTFLLSRLLQTFKGIELAPKEQPARSWMPGRVGERIMPEAPVVTLSLRGGVYLKFSQ